MQREYEYILEVYKSGCFSRAAQKLYLSQPALSIAVKKIESELGMPVFDRNTQPLKLTEAGTILLKKINSIQLLEKEMKNQLQELSELEAGELRIAGTQYFNSYVMPEKLNNFITAHPNIQLSLLEDNSGLLDEKLLDGSADIIFHCGEYDRNLFKGTEVFTDRLFLAVPKNYRLAAELNRFALNAEQICGNGKIAENQAAADFSLFKEIPFILLSRTNELRLRTKTICRDSGFEVQERFSAEQLETAFHLARKGLGATFITDRMIQDSKAGELVYFNISHALAKRSFSALRRKDSYESFAMKAFIQSF